MRKKEENAPSRRRACLAALIASSSASGGIVDCGFFCSAPHQGSVVLGVFCARFPPREARFKTSCSLPHQSRGLVSGICRFLLSKIKKKRRDVFVVCPSFLPARRPRTCDFCASPLPGITYYTQRTTFLGTPPYCSLKNSRMSFLLYRSEKCTQMKVVFGKAKTKGCSCA